MIANITEEAFIIVKEQKKKTTIENRIPLFIIEYFDQCVQVVSTFCPIVLLLHGFCFLHSEPRFFVTDGW
jgi:hypothetical protein